MNAATDSITLYAGWVQYVERAIPVDASVEQVRETRRAFYAGASFLFRAFTGDALAVPQVFMRADGFARELTDFADAVIEDKA